MIYIDPPYNTGKDFVYKDDFNDTLKAYKEQLSNITTNTNTDGRFHSNWLNMMYPRLRLAKNLLRDDGVIFISIDDNESAQLKLLCDEIFGRDNFVADFIRKTKSTTNDAKTGLNYQHEILYCYAKNKDFINLLGGDKDLSKYTNPDNDPNGEWCQSDPSAKSGTMQNNYFEVINPYTNKVDLPPKGMFWRFSKNTLQKHIDNGTICFKKEHKENERGFIYKRYKKDLKTTQKTLDSLIFCDNSYMNQNATKELLSLGMAEYFQYPKSVNFIKKLLEHSTNKDDIILDFFSGSATTAHAVMQLNALDSGNRKYILIQIPEPTEAKSIAYQNGYKNICEIGLTRIKKSSEKIKQDYPNASFDDGVKIFYLDSSNLSTWDGENITQENLFTKLEKIKQDRVGLDLVYEFILKQGYSLGSKIDYKNDKYFVKDGDKQMIICLKKSDFNELLKYKDSEIIIEDDLLDDDFKLNILNNLKNAKTF